MNQLSIFERLPSMLAAATGHSRQSEIPHATGILTEARQLER
jgi:hypothetical protein